jgi:hypothetical protein
MPFLLVLAALTAALIYRSRAQARQAARQCEYDRLARKMLELEIRNLERLLALAHEVGGKPPEPVALVRSLRAVLQTADSTRDNTDSRAVHDLANEIESLVLGIAELCDLEEAFA